MRIGIDARYLSHGLIGGVHTYVRNLVPALCERADGDEIILYADTKREFELDHLPPNTIVKRLPWKGPLSSIAHDCLLWREMARDHIDLAHFPSNYGFAPSGAASIVTLHDAINVLPLREIIRGHPKKARTMAMMTYLHICSSIAARRASSILTVSEHARREIARHVPIDARRIVVIPHGRPPDIEPVRDASILAATRRRFGLTGKIVLADALKNPDVLVLAWRRLPETLRADHQLVFFARHDAVLPIVRQAVAQEEAILLARPSRGDLASLYSMAAVFVFPSWIEGFGLPILEAMTCGAPVIASNRGAIPEVLGEGGLTVDALDAVRLSEHLRVVLSSPDVAEQQRQRGFARAEQFTWPRAAEETLAAYRTALIDG
jgi:glycosyltransferase involved in cell wall biosynthesis